LLLRKKFLYRRTELKQSVLIRKTSIERMTPIIVEHLTIRNADPFLIAVIGKRVSNWGEGDYITNQQAGYYIEVWDEPRFEGRLTKEE